MMQAAIDAARRTAEDFNLRYAEEVEEVSRALPACAYRVQFVGDYLFEGERLVLPLDVWLVAYFRSASGARCFIALSARSLIYDDNWTSTAIDRFSQQIDPVRDAERENTLEVEPRA